MVSASPDMILVFGVGVGWRDEKLCNYTTIAVNVTITIDHNTIY